MVRGAPASSAKRGVEVVDLAQAVAAEFQGVGEPAVEVLARVEVVLPEPDRRGVGVGDDHLGDGRPVDHGAPADGDLVQREALAAVEADPELPVGPGDLVAVDGEARPLGLGDLDRLEVGAGRGGVRCGVPLAALGRHRQVEQVVHRRRDAAGEVDVGDDAVDRVGPRQVGRVGLVEAEHPDGPVPELVLEVRAGRQRDRPDVGDVEAALGHGRDPAARRRRGSARWPRTPPRGSAPGRRPRRRSRCSRRRRRR